MVQFDTKSKSDVTTPCEKTYAMLLVCNDTAHLAWRGLGALPSAFWLDSYAQFAPSEPTRRNCPSFVASRCTCELSRRQSTSVCENLRQSEQFVIYRIILYWLLYATKMWVRLWPTRDASWRSNGYTRQQER